MFGAQRTQNDYTDSIMLTGGFGCDGESIDPDTLFHVDQNICPAA